MTQSPCLEILRRHDRVDDIKARISCKEPFCGPWRRESVVRYRKNERFRTHTVISVQNPAAPVRIGGAFVEGRCAVTPPLQSESIGEVLPQAE